MEAFLNIIKEIELKVNNNATNEDIQLLWNKLYLYEKYNKKKLNKKINELIYLEQNDIFYKLEELEIKPYYYLDVDPNLNNEITDFEQLKKLSNSILSDEQVILLLNTIIKISRNYISNNIKTDGLYCKCFEASEYITKMFGCLFSIYYLHTNDILNNNVFGHQFNVIEFNTINGVKRYIIDITYRQFYYISKCNINRIYHINEPNITPGYFFNDNFLATQLLENGYIELNEYNSKIYLDSFLLANLTKTNIDKNIFKIENEIHIDKNKYTKTLVKGTKLV